MGKLVIAILAIVVGVYLGGYVALRASGYIQGWAQEGNRAAMDFEYKGIAEGMETAYAPLNFVESEARGMSGNLPERKPQERPSGYIR